MANFGAIGEDGLANRFFTRQRIATYPLVFLAASILISLGWLLKSSDMLDPKGQPLGYDFITFWAGSWLTLNDSAAAVFDPASIQAAEQLAVPASKKLFLWHYPPTFLLLVAPLALIPYLVAYLLWGTGTFALYAAVIRKLAPQPQTLLLLLAFPGVFINFVHGQNAFVTAALLGGAMLCLERRPILAGILIGLMTYKPHFGILIPLALICGRHWTAFAAAAVTTLLFGLGSVLAFGIEPWIAFWENIPVARAVFQDGLVRWSKLPSFYASLRLAGAGQTAAYVLHGVLAAGVAAAVAWTWLRRPSLPLRAAVLSAGSLLVSPYMFDYDFAILAVPIALMAMDGYTRGWLSYERAILAATWVMPLVTASVAEMTGIQVGVVCVAALFAATVRRAFVDSLSPGPLAAPRPAT